MIGRSVGAVRLGQVSATGAEIAMRVGVSGDGIVSLWRSGKKKPGDANRAALFRVYGIPIGSWDEPYSPPSSEGSAPGEATDTPDDIARRIERIASLLLQKCETPGAIDAKDQARCLAAALSALSTIRKLRGDDDEIPERKILKTAAWKRIVETALEALKPWPDALRAFAEAVATLDD